jgi:hypothetical protein
VEGLVGYARRNFMVPVPRAASWEELNAQLLEQCRQRRERKLWGHEETIAERFERDRKRFLPLPATPLEACQKRTTRVSSQALVRFETNDYSVPVAYGHRQVLLKAFVWEVVISFRSTTLSGAARAEDQRPGPGGAATGLAVTERIYRAPTADGGTAGKTGTPGIRAKAVRDQILSTFKFAN